MKIIYAVGVIKYDFSNHSKSFLKKDERLWCLYSSFKKAEKVVLKNIGDIFEDYYNVAIIEEAFVWGNSNNNIYQKSPKQWWYKVDDSQLKNESKKTVIYPIPIPDKYKNVVNIWIG